MLRGLIDDEESDAVKSGGFEESSCSCYDNACERSAKRRGKHW